MRRVVLILLVAVLVIGIAWWIATLSGHVSMRIEGLTIETSAPVAAVAVGIGFMLLYAILRLLGGLMRLPRRLRERRAARHQRLGQHAVTRTLVALAAGDAVPARREAARAQRLLGPTPQALLLTAEAARLADRTGEAEAAFRALADLPDAAFIGLRGLLRQAIARESWTEAAELARRAEAAHPGAAWLRAERGRLAVRTGAWAEALGLAGTDGASAALATAAAEAETDPAASLRLAKRAFAADPSLAPAALAYASRLRAAGQENRAEKVLLQAWQTAPHPDLATLFLAPVTDQLERARVAQRLAAANPDHPESHLLLAQTALAAQLTGEARRHAEAARQGGIDQRRLWVLLADVEEAEQGDTEAGRIAARNALRRIASADPDPAWHCTACGTVSATWHPACPACGAAGRLIWTARAPLPPLPVPTLQE